MSSYRNWNSWFYTFRCFYPVQRFKIAKLLTLQGNILFRVRNSIASNVVLAAPNTLQENQEHIRLENLVTCLNCYVNDLCTAWNPKPEGTPLADVAYFGRLNIDVQGH